MTVTRDEFLDELVPRIDGGEELRDQEISNSEDLAAAENDYRIWNDYNRELLRRRFTTSEVSDWYARSLSSIATISLSGTTFSEELNDHRNYVNAKLQRLRSIKEQVPLYKVAPNVAVAPGGSPSTEERDIDAIFIVHGHDDALKLGVESFLRRATKIEPIILHAQPNRGRTLIEKLEATGARAGYAVVLLTADDVGAVKAKPTKLEPRARQNVVFEFGFFAGALGRAHVAVIYEPGVEWPTDLKGLVYIEYDGGGAWRNDLLRELREVGVSVDANALLG